VQGEQRRTGRAVLDAAAAGGLGQAVLTEAFVEVVAPVEGQRISGAIELVGCSSVYEGTVRYRVLSGDSVVVDSFTTATAGGPELGEFHEEIELPGTGSYTLEVFWDSPADGSEQDLVAIDVELS
jgi:hypothetical protein